MRVFGAGIAGCRVPGNWQKNIDGALSSPRHWTVAQRCRPRIACRLRGLSGAGSSALSHHHAPKLWLIPQSVQQSTGVLAVPREVPKQQRRLSTLIPKPLAAISGPKSGSPLGHKGLSGLLFPKFSTDQFESAVSEIQTPHANPFPKPRTRCLTSSFAPAPAGFGDVMPLEMATLWAIGLVLAGFSRRGQLDTPLWEWYVFGAEHWVLGGTEQTPGPPNRHRPTLREQRFRRGP
ncbi:MAG: hypothetical protein CM15mP120_12660 [Pseudomonadota bacterium]|nr:MAG: hypothetical protein CM15mP120_12660 [Pseudomonadota bacterium]